MSLLISLAFVGLLILVICQYCKLDKATKAAEHWRLQASENGSEAAYWRGMNTCSAQENADLRKQAEAFEQAAKAMEETLAGARERADRLKQGMLNECDRADRLDEALRISEEARCELKQQLEKMRKTVNIAGSSILDEMKRRSENPVFTAAMQHDWVNIMAYDGTAASQEALRDD